MPTTQPTIPLDTINHLREDEQMNELSRRTFVKGVAATAPLALVLGDPRL
ncbi:MAG: twin-arginine translocation signal domain-containing protein, partial [Rhodospirillales bacterium]|nr:twin-arginine translocation signal domain-containing protein [Rhodospirillales bacterium]